MATRKAYQQPVTDLFVSALWEQGHVTPLQFFRIAAWKSAQNLAELTINQEKDFVDRTGDAMTAILPFRNSNVIQESVNWDEWQRVVATAVGSKKLRTGLLGLQGVGYPVATAILAVLAPNSFPVMDRWALSEVFGISESAARSAKYHKAAAYRQYTERLVHTDDKEAICLTSIHARDQLFMSRAQSRATSKRTV